MANYFFLLFLAEIKPQKFMPEFLIGSYVTSVLSEVPESTVKCLVNACLKKKKNPSMLSWVDFFFFLKKRHMRKRRNPKIKRSSEG
jgi:hypothetical protein